MQKVSLAVLAELLEGEIEGSPSVLVERVQAPEEAGQGDIAVVIGRRHVRAGELSKASAIVAPRGLELEVQNLIRVRDARRALATLIEHFHPEPRPKRVVEEGAFVHPDSRIADDVFVGAGACIAAGAVLAEGVEVHSNAVVGERARVGSGTILYPNVTVYPEVSIGSRVRIHSGTVIGSPGFSARHGEDGRCEGLPQVGTVEIADDVEIGAGCTIDRSTLGTTRIGRGTRIDNLVQIGHNCQIGENCIIIAQVGISGSVTLGDGCIVAGQAGISDHVTLEPGCVVGAKAGVIRDLSTGMWIGYPAMPAVRARRVYNQLEALPEMKAQLTQIHKRCAALEDRMLENGRDEVDPTARDPRGA